MDYSYITMKQEQLNRVMRIYFESFFIDLGVTSTQALVLDYVMEHVESVDVFPKDIEAFLTIRRASVSSLLNNLERDGYITREKAGDDGRYRRVLPTDKALNIKKPIRERIQKYNNQLFEGISNEELKTFQDVLDKIYGNIR